MSGMLGLGNWLGMPGAQQQGNDPLAGYAQRMRGAGMGAPVQSPLVAAYTPPAYQTTPPHVDVQAIIDAMNAQNRAQQTQSPMAPGLPGMMPGEGANNGPGDVLNGDAAQNAQGAATDPNVGGTAVESVGYQAGGYTGDAPVTQPVGLVHGQEEVISAPATKAVGRKTLDKINEGDPKAVAIATKVAERVGAKNDRPEKRGEKK